MVNGQFNHWSKSQYSKQHKTKSNWNIASKHCLLNALFGCRGTLNAAVIHKNGQILDFSDNTLRLQSATANVRCFLAHYKRSTVYAGVDNCRHCREKLRGTLLQIFIAYSCLRNRSETGWEGCSITACSNFWNCNPFSSTRRHSFMAPIG